MTTAIISKLALSEKSDIAQYEFKRMPVLYLEFIENRFKVQPELLDKPYESVEISHENDSSPTEIIPENASAPLSEQDKIESLAENQPLAEKQPPTLTELRKQDPTNPALAKSLKIPRADDPDLMKRRNEVFFHYEVLKRMHPKAKSRIPEFTQFSDPEIMSRQYEVLAKELSLDSSIETWKRSMIIFVMVMEVALGKLSFDMEGFAQQQLVQMPMYESLLVEIAEKSYTPTSNKWPVEVRLLGVLAMNTALFMISKMLMKKNGANLLGLINNLSSSLPQEKQMRPPEN